MKRFLKLLLGLIVVAAIAIFVARQLFPVPSTEGRAQETALPAAAASPLAVALAGQASANPGKSGVVELAEGPDALSARLFLIDNAQSSVDAQYYIWHDDTSGRMMFRSVLAAAERGVKVRLLLDDNGIPGLDEIVSSLNAHPNISIRLFNPSMIRSPKLVGYSFDFFRMNRRMHNKALIVDGVAAVIGGRNIGDIYFHVGDGSHYIDLDALAVGKVVADVQSEFDLYWNSRSAIDAGLVLTAQPGDAKAQIDAPGPHVSDKAREDASTRYKTFANALNAGAAFEWTTVDVYYDDPSKGLGEATTDQLLISRVGKAVGDANIHSELASAYFVPGGKGVEFFTSLVKKGVKVRILTNSADANDVLLVHSGYLKYRRPLLEGGVELFELKRTGPPRSGGLDLDDFKGSSEASLHAKTFSLDNERIFIGSFNFDPRSVNLNCEMGMMIHSPRMATAMAEGFDNRLKFGAYRPVISGGDIIWFETEPDGRQKIIKTEPNMSLLQRIVLRAVGFLPIEWVL